LQLHRDVLPREGQLDIHLGDRSAGPGTIAILRKVDTGTIQGHGAAATTKGNRLIIADSHPLILLRRRDRTYDTEPASGNFLL
jgi:hypothetical protein